VKVGDLVIIDCNRFTDAKRMAFQGILGEHGTVLSVDGYTSDVLVKEMIVTILTEYLKKVEKDEA